MIYGGAAVPIGRPAMENACVIAKRLASLSALSEDCGKDFFSSLGADLKRWLRLVLSRADGLHGSSHGGAIHMPKGCQAGLLKGTYIGLLIVNNRRRDNRPTGRQRLRYSDAGSAAIHRRLGH